MGEGIRACFDLLVVLTSRFCHDVVKSETTRCIIEQGSQSRLLTVILKD